MHATPAPSHTETVTTSNRWWGFALYGVLSVIHVAAIIGAWEIDTITKLVLMPALVGAVVWAARGIRWSAPLTLLVVALAFSWLGDGAAVFFPFAPSVPMMMLWFGLAHLCYIWLFTRHFGRGRFPLWTLVYVAWWIGILLILWPHLGALSWAVAVYGLLLGTTAATAARCRPLIAWGGVFFLASDTILAFLLFFPGFPHTVMSPLVMVTYCLGQGLIAAGAVATVRSRAVKGSAGSPVTSPAEAV